MKILLSILLPIFLVSVIHAQDWANLNHFKKENKNINSSNQKKDIIVFMGDSITESWDKLDSSFFNGKPYINRGISGQTTPQMLLRFRQDVVNLNPKVVLILAGTNDIAGNTGASTLDMILNNIISMTQLAKSNNIEVILCSVLPVLDYPWKHGLNPAEKIDSLNQMIKKYSNENNIIYLDYYSSMVNEHKGLNSQYTYDGVHPNKKGYEIMAPLAEDAINKALNKNAGKRNILGLRTTVYKVENLEKAKTWYAKTFEINPYFDEPFYVGFNIGGYELGLLPEEITTSIKSESVIIYWGVEDIEKAYQHFIKLGATEHEKPHSVGEPLIVASVIDPWGNIIGLIYNPVFKLDK